jgi:alpha-beta hydrolase superfamily lysophospholipase
MQMDYVLSHSASRDGKVLGVGHSMGGILLYAMLATRAKQAALAGAVTVASSLDYGVSNTSLKHLLPLADPAVLFNVPVIPLGALMSALHPLVSRPPYALSYLGYQVSARQMMDPALFKKLVLNNFCKAAAAVSASEVVDCIL